MPAPKISKSDLLKAIERYENGDRPWRQIINRVDWFIIQNEILYPLKYTYALAVNVPPAEFTTNQMKSAMSHLSLTFHSLKAQEENENNFQNEVQNSLKDPQGRKKRLRTSNPIPKTIIISHLAFLRNPDVVAEILDRANGICENCRNNAPFSRRADGTPYLEVHHKIFLSEGGKDTVENAEALCPNCHREKHFG